MTTAYELLSFCVNFGRFGSPRPPCPAPVRPLDTMGNRREIARLLLILGTEEGEMNGVKSLFKSSLPNFPKGVEC